MTGVRQGRVTVKRKGMEGLGGSLDRCGLEQWDMEEVGAGGGRSFNF